MNFLRHHGLIPRPKMTETSTLVELLQHSYGLTVKKLSPLKTVTGILCADDSRWIWKEARPRDTERRFHAMNEIQALLGESGITCAAPVPNQQGRYLTRSSADHDGYLQPWLEGHHVQLSDRQERLAAFATIAAMHQLTRHGRVSDSTEITLLTGSLQSRLLKKHRAMSQAWIVAQHQLPDLKSMEKLVFQNMTRVLERFYQWQLPGEVTFCHRDLAPHNLLFSDTGRPQISIIDLDQSGYDLPYLDILQLCNHSLHFSDIQSGLFHEVLQIYTRNTPMGAEQRLWMWELLRFPDLLIRTTVEWVAYGCPDGGREKVLSAARKEQLRLQLLNQSPG